MYTSYLGNVIHLLLRSQLGVDIVFALCCKNQYRSSSAWSEKSASDELSGEDTKQLSTYAPVEYCKNTTKL